MATSEDNDESKVSSLAKRFERLIEDSGTQKNVNDPIYQSTTNQETESFSTQVAVFIVHSLLLHEYDRQICITLVATYFRTLDNSYAYT